MSQSQAVIGNDQTGDRVLTTLSEDEQMFRASVREFAEGELRPRVEEMDAHGKLDPALIKQCFDLGLMGIETPEEFGGAGSSFFTAIIAVEELSSIDASVGVFVDVQNTLVNNALIRWGTQAQKEKYLAALASEKVGAYALSEAGSGSDVVSMRLTAEKRGDRYVLDGTKMWITNGPDADVLVVYAKTDGAAGARGMTAFIVESAFPGFSASPKLDKLGMRGSNTCELVFQDCEVPATNVLGATGKGVNVLMSGLDYERAVLAAGPLGIMQACLDVVLPYVHERKQFGQAIGEFQLMQGKLADMYTTLSACKSYAYAVGRACDDGRITRKDAAGVILYTAEKATWMALEAIQCLGGVGYTNDYPTGRLLRDAKLYEIGAGTSEIRRMLIGRELFDETK